MQNLGREEVRNLKRALMTALEGKLPLVVGQFKLIASATRSPEDTFLSIRVDTQDGKQHISYLEVDVRERF